jgi:hypothetical protein
LTKTGRFGPTEPKAKGTKKFVGVYDQTLLNNPATRSGGQKSPRPKADPFLKQIKDVDNEGRKSRGSEYTKKGNK